MILIIKFFFIIQLTHIIPKIYAGYENHVAFQCGRPSMVFKNGKWNPDFQQNCIKDEMGIVSYCRQAFPESSISSAEPAIERVNFTKWCDFNNQNCDVNMKIRPFKCLDANFQSDALTLPKNCLFAHLGGKEACKLYKDWIIDAKKECSSKQGWKVKSYGMLFQCGAKQESVKPMFFRGVEFVCCPQNKTDEENMNEKHDEENVYKHYLRNGILEGEHDENKVYKEALKKLIQSEEETKKDVIKDFKNGEETMKKLWKTDPKLAKLKESSLISQFKLAYGAIFDQYQANREQLLIFHDDRLKFIFTAKYEAAIKQLEETLKKPVKKEDQILDAMKPVLELLMIRKQEIMEERVVDQNLGSRMIDILTQELVFIENTITNVFNKLNQVPKFKVSIKQQLVMYIMNKFPRISFEKNTKIDDKRTQINRIISKFKFNSGFEANKDDNEFQVHYDLGIHDKDQEHHYGKSGEKFFMNRETMENQYGNKSLLFSIIGGILVTAFVILIVGSMLVISRHRATMFKYTKPRFQDQQSKHMMKGFGTETNVVSKDIDDSKPFNVYENPTYNVEQTALNGTQDIAKVHKSDSTNEKMDSPLIH